jgi:hypothetical protein
MTVGLLRICLREDFSQDRVLHLSGAIDATQCPERSDRRLVEAPQSRWLERPSTAENLWL